jgi:hypothetical protein
MPQVKAGKVLKSVRLPDAVFSWLEQRAEYHGTTLSGEIATAVRDRMEREAQEARASAAAPE